MMPLTQIIREELVLVVVGKVRKSANLNMMPLTGLGWWEKCGKESKKSEGGPKMSKNVGLFFWSFLFQFFSVHTRPSPHFL
jgi:hypothetical protein